MNIYFHAHKFALSLMTIDSQLPGESIVVNFWFLLHDFKDKLKLIIRDIMPDIYIKE